MLVKTSSGIEPRTRWAFKILCSPPMSLGEMRLSPVSFLALTHLSPCQVALLSDILEIFYETLLPMCVSLFHQRFPMALPLHSDGLGTARSHTLHMRLVTLQHSKNHPPTVPLMTNCERLFTSSENSCSRSFLRDASVGWFDGSITDKVM